MDSSAVPNPPDARASFWNVRRGMLTMAGAGVILALGFAGCNSTEKTTNTPKVTASPGTGSPAPTQSTPAAFITLPQEVRDLKVETLDGGSLKLSDYNDKVVVVNIWATWCGPCRQEMPELVKMSAEYKARGLVVLGLATSYNENNDPTRAKEFVKSQGVDYKIIWDDGTLAVPLLQSVRAKSVIPQSFVIARGGRIVKHFQGFSILSTPKLIRVAIEEALDEKTKA